MYKITDVKSLGKNYTISDPDGNVIKMIQIIAQSEILKAALGEYTEDFGTYQEYLDKSVAVMTGFDITDLTKILWYSSTNEQVVLTDVVEYAMQNGYDKIILEHLADLE